MEISVFLKKKFDFDHFFLTFRFLPNFIYLKKGSANSPTNFVLSENEERKNNLKASRLSICSLYELYELYGMYCINYGTVCSVPYELRYRI